MNFIDTLDAKNLSLSTVQKPYLDLCHKLDIAQTRLAIVQRNSSKCSDENLAYISEIQKNRDLSFRATEKLNRISSLCLDLRKRLEFSATQSAIEDERNKRMELNDSFAIDVQNISKRIANVAANKQLNSIANESLRLQLTSSIDTFHITENPIEMKELSFELEFHEAEDAILQSTELAQMEYEDYLGHVGCSIAMQLNLRELLSSYNDKFHGFQNRLAENNLTFESHRKRIDAASEIAKTKHMQCSESAMEIKSLKKSLKIQSLLYAECTKNVEKEFLKKEKILNLMEVFTADIAAKEQDLLALKAARKM